jgi:NADPH-dependent F420 reductase
MSEPLPCLAVIGGTGALGGALAARWAGAGYRIILGSRSPDKARAAAAAITASASPVRGMDNAAAARSGDIVVVTVPFASHGAILAGIRGEVGGKIVVDATVPLRPPKVGTVQMPPEGSAALAARRLLADTGAEVVSALHSVAAHKLARGGHVDCDVLVCGDRADAREQVITLVRALGLRGLHAGPLANSVAPEALTSVLIHINRRYGVDGAGVRITGLIAEPGKGT